MTGFWQSLVELIEAKSPSQLKDDLYRYMVRRYDEHRADEAMALMQRVPIRDFARQMEAEYFDSRINATIQDMIKAATPADQRRGPGRPRKDEPAREPGVSTDKGSGPSEPIPQRPGAGRQEPSVLHRPGTRQGQEPGTAGQNAPRPQPSQQIQPSTAGRDLERLRAQRAKIAADPRKAAELQKIDAQIASISKSGESGLMDAQRQVDYVTQTYGKDVGDRLAKRLRVPSSSERGGELGGDRGSDWVKKPTVLSPDAIAKRMDPDITHRSTPANAGELPAKEPGGTRGGPLKPMMKDPETGEMVVRPGDFAWQRWQPAGVSRKVQTARPDQATGNTVRGSRYTNPAGEGEPMFWDPEARDWISKSQALAVRAQRKAGG
jgi:hypothetical protein